VDHIDRNSKNDSINNLRRLPASENIFRRSTKEEQANLGYEPKPKTKKVAAIKYQCEKEDSAWTDLGVVGGNNFPKLQFSIMADVRNKKTKKYEDHNVTLATGYRSITIRCDKNKTHTFSVHTLMRKVFKLHYEENPVKGVSTDPRKDQPQTASLYLTAF
jgi:hypothetical protein